jgi:hypothetical protein
MPQLKPIKTPQKNRLNEAKVSTFSFESFDFVASLLFATKNPELSKVRSGPGFGMPTSD